MKISVSHEEFSANLETTIQMATGFSGDLDKTLAEFNGMSAVEYYTKYPIKGITVTERSVEIDIPEKLVIGYLNLVGKYSKMVKPFIKVIISAFEAFKEIAGNFHDDLELLFAEEKKGETGQYPATEQQQFYGDRPTDPEEYKLWKKQMTDQMVLELFALKGELKEMKRYSVFAVNTSALGTLLKTDSLHGLRDWNGLSVFVSPMAEAYRTLVCIVD